MQERLKQWQEAIDARVIRERVLIFLCMLAAVFMLWNFLIQSSFDSKRRDLEAQIASAETDQKNLQAQIATITQSLLNDPARTKKAQITQLESDIAGVNSELQSVSQSLIKAEQLPLALQDVLQKTERVTLLEVNTLPTTELQLTQLVEGASAKPEATKEARNAGVYMHVVELKLSGNYSQVVQLLKSLEQLPWRFYWQTLDYKVLQYPDAEIELRVYTLSAEEGLLGV